MLSLIICLTVFHLNMQAAFIIGSNANLRTTLLHIIITASQAFISLATECFFFSL